jgi:hypothetical protein
MGIMNTAQYSGPVPPIGTGNGSPGIHAHAMMLRMKE